MLLFYFQHPRLTYSTHGISLGYLSFDIWCPFYGFSVVLNNTYSVVGSLLIAKNRCSILKTRKFQQIKFTHVLCFVARWLSRKNFLEQLLLENSGMKLGFCDNLSWGQFTCFHLHHQFSWPWLIFKHHKNIIFWLSWRVNLNAFLLLIWN